jgi:hypothetical protein
MEFVRLRAHQYQKFDGSVVQNAKKTGEPSQALTRQLSRRASFYASFGQHK